MLAVSALRSENKDDNQGEMASANFTMDTQEFPDFSDTNLLDSIVLDDLFLGMDDGYVFLPDLEMDPADVLAEFSVSGRDGEDSEMNTSVEKAEDNLKKEEDKVSGSGSGLGSSLSKGEEIVSKRDETASLKALAKDGDKGRKSSSQTKNNYNNQGKRKLKVDWTPELHRRFVQAVEQLGVDKAVPSRILELMGIDCLTRHNIASHLQKYRSHRKHMLAREAEAASLSQRKQMYGAADLAGGGGGGRDINQWLAPTIGFPPLTPPMHPHHHFIRPLHVWGHPTMDQTLMHVWPKPVAHSPSPPPPLPPQLPVSVPPSWAHRPCPPYWHHHHQQQVPNGLTRGTPCFPQALATKRFPALPVPGIPPHHHSLYKVEPPGIGFPTAQSGPHPLIDFHPSKESIDAAIGDVISKPWLPLPLGLKPPSIDSVMGELQRQGLPKIPPTSCA